MAHNPIDIHVGKRLRYRRRLMDMTQADVGDLLGVRFQQIQKYEKGLNSMSVKRLWQAAEALDVDVGYFFEGLDEPEQQARPARLRLVS